MRGRMRIILAAALPLLLAAPALADPADSDRPFCASRPGMGTPACVVAPGQAMVELGLIDWTGDSTAGARQDSIAGARQDSIAGGEALVRVGIGERWEAQLGWNGFVRQRVRDGVGAVTITRGAGDALVAIKYNLLRPDGGGVSLAVLPFASLPVGARGIGAGDWAAGVTVPFSVALNDTTGVAFTPQVSAAVNGSGQGRHLAYGGVIGLSRALTGSLGLTGELAWSRDEDPAGASHAGQ